MERNDALYQAYCAILREELVPATGCTEPIALAYCAAKARHALGRMPDRVRARLCRRRVCVCTMTCKRAPVLRAGP